MTPALIHTVSISSGRLIAAIPALPPSGVTYAPATIRTVAAAPATSGSQYWPPIMKSRMGVTYSVGTATPGGVTASARKISAVSPRAPARIHRGSRLTGGAREIAPRGSSMA
jgi:hypothetical protein